MKRRGGGVTYKVVGYWPFIDFIFSGTNIIVCYTNICLMAYMSARVLTVCRRLTFWLILRPHRHARRVSPSAGFDKDEDEATLTSRLTTGFFTMRIRSNKLARYLMI